MAKDIKSSEQTSEERVEILLNEALTKDEAGFSEDALKLYTQGVEFCLSAAQAAADESQSKRYRVLATCALERAEKIKARSPSTSLELPEVPADDLKNVHMRRDDPSNAQPAVQPCSSPRTHSLARTSELSAQELRILARTSKVGKLTLLPFLHSDLNERFVFPLPYT